MGDKLYAYLNYSAEGMNACDEELAAKGYKILARNFRTRQGEIDLVAKKGDRISFVEVKLRRIGSRSLPREAVDCKKQAKLRAAAKLFIARYPQYAEHYMQFDVAEVYDTGPLGLRVQYLPAAFE